MDEIIDIDDLRKLKLPELKAMCKQNGIPSTGPKEVLIKRLCVSMGMDEEDEGVDEDALLEGEDKEDDEEEEEEDACISSSDDKEESVEPTESNETTSDSVVGGGEEGSTPLESPKKEDPAIVDKDKENETGVSPSKKIKLIEAPPADPPKPVSELTDAERLKLRAEKYGVNTSKGALSSKEARAARFGLASEKKASPAAAAAKVAGVAKNVSAEDLEKMKQRGARFGATVSSTMSSVDNVDKILKRKERFGEVTATTTSATTSEAAAKEKRAARFGASKTTTSTTTSTEADELKKKRAERFKIPV